MLTAQSRSAHKARQDDVVVGRVVRLDEVNQLPRVPLLRRGAPAAPVVDYLPDGRCEADKTRPGYGQLLGCDATGARNAVRQPVEPAPRLG